MASNETEEETMMLEDCKRSDTYPFYTLPLAYSLLAAAIIGHLLLRWHFRRRKLSRFRSSQPGDKSFKSKMMRTILKRDMINITTVTCDPRLINTEFPPSDFGDCKGDEEVPRHWYRMAAFDAAAEFVSTYAPKDISTSHFVLEDHTYRPHPLYVTPLPEFLKTLSLPRDTLPSLLPSLTELYQLARYKDGDFGREKLQLFRGQLNQLREKLDRRRESTFAPLALAVSSTSFYSSSAHHPPPPPSQLYNRQSTTTYSSQDPLLRMSSGEVMTPEEPTSSGLGSKDIIGRVQPILLPRKQPPTSVVHKSPRSKTKSAAAGTASSSSSAALESELLPLVTTQTSPTTDQSSSREPWKQLESLETEI